MIDLTAHISDAALIAEISRREHEKGQPRAFVERGWRRGAVASAWPEKGQAARRAKRAA